MNSENALATVEALANSLGQSVDTLIGYYVPWVSIYAWIGLVGVLILSFALFGYGSYLWLTDRDSTKQALSEQALWGIGSIVLGAIILIVGGINNLPDIIAPEAASITKILYELSRVR